MQPRRKANSNLWLEALLALSKTLATRVITHLSPNDAKKLRLVVVAPVPFIWFGARRVFQSSQMGEGGSRRMVGFDGGLRYLGFMVGRGMDFDVCGLRNYGR
jgi:hypothetical protein